MEDPARQDRRRTTETAYDLLQRGTALLDGRHHAQAAIVLERADRLEPGKGSILEALGRAYYNSGQAERAARDLRGASRGRSVVAFRALRARPEPETARTPERGRHASATGGRAQPGHPALPRCPRTTRVGPQRSRAATEQPARRRPATAPARAAPRATCRRGTRPARPRPGRRAKGIRSTSRCSSSSGWRRSPSASRRSWRGRGA